MFRINSEYEKNNSKHIYKNGNRYGIRKRENGKYKYYGTYPTFNEAVNVRDKLIANDWKSIPEIHHSRKVREYFRYIELRKNRYAVVVRKKYYGMVGSIEEALYYRDLIIKNKYPNKKPADYDLITNNPYSDGLEYDLPKRLIPEPKEESNWGKGSIVKKGPQSYHIYRGSVYYCACRTYEYAYYMRQELNKYDWDKSKLPEIKEGYPEWYTWLVNFYKYIIPADNPVLSRYSWIVNLTPKKNNGKLEHLRFNRLEDALWERDLLLEYDFDYDALVYSADDSLNPYYNMDLPPYPERKIRNISERKSHEKELREVQQLILDGVTSKIDVCENMGLNQPTLSNWLKTYNTTFKEFKRLCLSGVDPFSVLELQPLILKPDLSYHRSKNDYISTYSVEDNRSPYVIQRHGVYYGKYRTMSDARKVVTQLKRVDWDKSKLDDIRCKLGLSSVVGSKNWIYENKSGDKICSYSIRKKDHNKVIHYFGTYKDYDKAVYVRDELIRVGWCDDKYPDIRARADELFPEVDDIGDRYVYRKTSSKGVVSYYIRKNNIQYGTYKDKTLALGVRDELIRVDWDKGLLDDIVERVKDSLTINYSGNDVEGVSEKT